jgi:hypothetical protein
MIHKEFNRLPILGEEHWLIDGTLAPQGTRWFGGKEKIYLLNMEVSCVDIPQCQS